MAQASVRNGGAWTKITDEEHRADTSDAHDASAISIADVGGHFTGTDVEAALQELGAGGGGGGAPADASYLVTTADGTLSNEVVVGTTPGGELGGTWASPTVDTTHAGSTHDAAANAHIADTTDAHDASAISFTPAGTISATDVQAAIEEVAAEAAGSIDWGETGDITTLDYDDTADAGVLNEAARADHRHGMPSEGGGSGGTYSGFALDTIPASAHAKDDEFPGSSLNVKWTDPLTSASGQTNTIVVANGAVTIEPSASGTSSTGKRVFGIRQNAPTGSFSVSARVGETNSGSDIRSGIFVAVTGGKAHVCGQFRQDQLIGAIGVTTYSESADWSGFDGYTVTTSPVGLYWTPGWVRIRWDSASSTLFFDYSYNGIYWTQFNSRTSMTQPDRIGICIYSNSGTVNADAKVGADWFRVTEP